MASGHGLVGLKQPGNSGYMVYKVLNLRPTYPVQGFLLSPGVMLQVIYGYLAEMDSLKVAFLDI